MDFSSAGHTNLESSEESLKLKLKLPENGFVLPSEGKTYEQTRTYLGTSTSLFTNVKNAANPLKKSPKDSIAFSRSLHQSKGSLLDRSKMRANTWRETTKCPSEQVIERSHARELAKANGSLCVVMSFRHRQNATSIRYMLLDKACLPGGEKAFYFYSLCPYCGCSFTQSGFPLGLENLEKWEGIFQSGKSQGILNRLEKSGKITQNTGKLWEFEINII